MFKQLKNFKYLACEASYEVRNFEKKTPQFSQVMGILYDT